MVNAVLRKAVVTEVHEDDFAAPLQRLGTYYCLSPAVAKLLYNQYGEEAFAMAAAFYERPATAIRVNTLRKPCTWKSPLAKARPMAPCAAGGVQRLARRKPGLCQGAFPRAGLG